MRNNNKRGQNSLLFLFVRMVTSGLVLIFTTTSIVQAQAISRVGTTAATFVKVGVGARGMAMGEAFSTLANDATATYWNPACLANVENLELSFNHFEYFADIAFDNVSIALPMGSAGSFGLNITYMGMPEFERTTINIPTGTGEKVGASSFVLGGYYAKALTDRFTFGGGVKFIQETLWHESANGTAVDMGFYYRSKFNNITIGMSVSNFGSSINLDGRDLLITVDPDPTITGNNSTVSGALKTDEYDLPLFFRLGISANLLRDFLDMESHDLIIALDAIHPNDNYEYLNIGGEYVYNKLFALRAGYRQLLLEDAQAGPTFGFGVNLNFSGYRLAVDYAAIDQGIFGYLNNFSLIFAIN